MKIPFEELSGLAGYTRLNELRSKVFSERMEQYDLAGATPIFNDALEQYIFLYLLDRALKEQVGATSALVADETGKTKNTVNVRLERLFYKGLVSKVKLGNSLLYFYPVANILLNVVWSWFLDMTDSEETTEKPEETLRGIMMDDLLARAPRAVKYSGTDHKARIKEQMKL